MTISIIVVLKIRMLLGGAIFLRKTGKLLPVSLTLINYWYYLLRDVLVIASFKNAFGIL